MTNRTLYTLVTPLDVYRTFSKQIVGDDVVDGFGRVVGHVLRDARGYILGIERRALSEAEVLAAIAAWKRTP